MQAAPAIIGRAEILRPVAHFTLRVTAQGETIPAAVCITPQDRQLKSFLRDVDKRHERHGKDWEGDRMMVVARAVRDRIEYALEDTSAAEARMELYRRHAGEPVPVGAFISMGYAVCIEQAIIAHVALSHIGVQNFLTWGRMEHENKRGEIVIGNHVWVETSPGDGGMVLEATNGGVMMFKQTRLYEGIYSPDNYTTSVRPMQRRRPGFMAPQFPPPRAPSSLAANGK